MKTPQQIRNEVEKKDYKEVDKWIEECDVDGRMIEFEFFDSDIEDLKNCIKREKLSILTEYDKSIKVLIKDYFDELYGRTNMGMFKKELPDELLSKIGDDSDNSQENLSKDNPAPLDTLRGSKIGDVHSQQEEDELKVNETASINQNKLDVNSPADTFSKEDSEDTCICGHHTKDHSYDPNKLDADLECDICDCKGFRTKEDRSFLGGYAELWDNPEDNRWDKEYNPDLLPETLKNKEEKQDDTL